MAKAIVPTEMPRVPEDMQGWRRSLRRGSVYHLHDALGRLACRDRHLGRNESEAPRNLGDLQYWGACPRCFRLAAASAGSAE